MDKQLTNRLKKGGTVPCQKDVEILINQCQRQHEQVRERTRANTGHAVLICMTKPPKMKMSDPLHLVVGRCSGSHGRH